MANAPTAIMLLLLALTGCSSETGLVAASPAVPIHNDLTGIACPNASLCFAVGDSFVNSSGGYTGYRTLIERWNGSSWSVIDSPNSASDESHLGKVSCATSSLCFAVGYDGPYIPKGRTLIEKWDGSSWSIARSPQVGNAPALLRDVNCASPSLCFAVGQTAPTQGNGSALIERWDGSSWTVIPNVHEGMLFGVGCASPSMCFATGIDYTFDGSHTVSLHLTEFWDGSTWRLVPSGSREGEYEVDSVSCTSRTYCAGSGSFNNQFASLSMLEAWDGVSWRAVETPHPALEPGDAHVFDRLISVSCVDASFCQAVGSHRWDTPHDTHSATLAERWGGSSWQIVSSPNGHPSPGTGSALQAVACLTRSRCLAIGHYDALDGHLMVLAERWNGTSWSIVPSDNRT